MAGVGLLLRRLNPYHSFVGAARVYSTAAVISSGPWLVSIAGILVVGRMSLDAKSPAGEGTAFQVSVTYLLAGSLVLTGLLQFLFTRFIADRLFESRSDLVAPNLMGALTLGAGAAALVGIVILFGVPGFGRTSAEYRLLMGVGFVLLSSVWIVVILLTALKAYGTVVGLFVASYLGIVVVAWTLREIGNEGFLSAFLLGQAFILFALLVVVLREYPSEDFVRFDFLRRSLIFPELALTGLFYNLGIWADKVAFWLHPDTGVRVIGPLRASLVYDVPVFLAYLSIVPGMSVFLVRVETDFAELYDEFYDMVREGAPLRDIERTRDRMIEAVRHGLYEILKVQGITLALAWLLAPDALAFFGISHRHLGLLYLLLVGVAAQVLLLSILNVLFYLDQRAIALGLCVLFALSNAGLTFLTLVWGPWAYGYGFTAAGILTVTLGLWALSQRLEHLVRETFMLQGVTR